MRVITLHNVWLTNELTNGAPQYRCSGLADEFARCSLRPARQARPRLVLLWTPPAAVRWWCFVVRVTAVCSDRRRHVQRTTGRLLAMVCVLQRQRLTDTAGGGGAVVARWWWWKGTRRRPPQLFVRGSRTNCVCNYVVLTAGSTQPDADVTVKLSPMQRSGS